jgi:hypothetical protein
MAGLCVLGAACACVCGGEGRTGCGGGARSTALDPPAPSPHVPLDSTTERPPFPPRCPTSPDTPSPPRPPNSALPQARRLSAKSCSSCAPGAGGTSTRWAQRFCQFAPSAPSLSLPRPPASVNSVIRVSARARSSTCPARGFGGATGAPQLRHSYVQARRDMRRRQGRGQCHLRRQRGRRGRGARHPQAVDGPYPPPSLGIGIGIATP